MGLVISQQDIVGASQVSMAYAVKCLLLQVNRVQITVRMAEYVVQPPTTVFANPNGLVITVKLMEMAGDAILLIVTVITTEFVIFLLEIAFALLGLEELIVLKQINKG